MKLDVDICLVSVRRFGVLKRTVKSFQRFVFPHFNIANVFVNIDPFLGSAADEQRMIELLKTHFPQATIRRPDRPGFCEAVRWTWQQAQSPYILHMEDDWLAHEAITSRKAEPLFTADVIKVAFMNASFAWNGRDRFSVKRRRHKFLGIPYARSVENRFGTSPGLWKRDAAQKIAAMMDTDLDPEKQMKRHHNAQLFDFLKRYRCAYLIGQNRPEIISDIGREWLAEQGFRKFVKDGRSWWETV